MIKFLIAMCECLNKNPASSEFFYFLSISLYLFEKLLLVPNRPNVCKNQYITYWFLPNAWLADCSIRVFQS